MDVQEEEDKQFYPQVSRDVGSGQDPRGRGEENGEHAEEASLRPSPARHEVSSKDIGCSRGNSSFSGELKCHRTQITELIFTFVAEKPFGLFLWGGGDEGSHDVVNKRHHDDQEEQNLSLWREEHTGNTQGTYREHTGNTQGTYREHTGNIQGTYREHTGNTQGTYREHTGNIQ